MSAWLVIADGVGSGLLGGYYLTVLRALHRWPREDATKVMMVINRMTVRAPFMTPFFGATALCGVTALDK